MNTILTKKFVLSFILTSSVVAPVIGVAAEDFVSSAAQLHTRTLAASCAACHGSNGNALAGNAVLAGMDKAYFIAQMLAFKNGDKPAAVMPTAKPTVMPTVMHRHAKGLQIDEINQLASYFSAQKKVKATSPVPQTLKANHD